MALAIRRVCLRAAAPVAQQLVSSRRAFTLVSLPHAALDRARVSSGPERKKGGHSGGKGKAAAAPAAVPAEDDAGSEDSDASGEEDEGDGFDAAAMFKKMDARMKRHVARCQQSMQKLRSGAASGGMLDHLQILAYGKMMPLTALGQPVLKNSNLLVINVFDQSVAEPIVAAILASGMNLNPAVEGSTVKVPLPKQTKENREELAKVASRVSESVKQQIRKVRKNALDKLKRAKSEMPEDEYKKATNRVQDFTDKYSAEVQKLLDRKTAELSKA